jgi:hypothetical protein
MRKEEWVVVLAIVALGFLLRAFIHTNGNDHFSLLLLIGFMIRPVIHNLHVSRRGFKTLSIGVIIAACVIYFPHLSDTGKNADIFVSVVIGLPLSLVLDFDLGSNTEKTQPAKNSMARFAGTVETATAWVACMGMLHRVALDKYDEQIAIISIVLFFIARGVAVNSIMKNKSTVGICIGIPASVIFSGLSFTGVIDMSIDCWINNCLIVALLTATLILRVEKC